MAFAKAENAVLNYGDRAPGRAWRSWQWGSHGTTRTAPRGRGIGIRGVGHGVVGTVEPSGAERSNGAPVGSARGRAGGGFATGDPGSARAPEPTGEPTRSDHFGDTRRGRRDGDRRPDRSGPKDRGGLRRGEGVLRLHQHDPAWGLWPQARPDFEA